jgi:hypothetical protein
MIMVKTYSYKKQGNTALSPHFKVREFRSYKGAKLYSDTILIDTELVAMLEKLYAAVEKLGHKVVGIYVNSGYRTAAHSVAIGGYSTDPHTKGIAADIMIKVKSATSETIRSGLDNYLDGRRICCLLQDLGAHGIGYIGGRAVHVDTRSGKWWGDETNGKTVSDWYDFRLDGGLNRGFNFGNTGLIRLIQIGFFFISQLVETQFSCFFQRHMIHGDFLYDVVFKPIPDF